VPAHDAGVRPWVQVQACRDGLWRPDRFNFEVAFTGVMALALDVGFLGVRSRQDGGVWPFELGQVPAEPLVAADDPASSRPDDDEPFVF